MNFCQLGVVSLSLNINLEASEILQQCTLYAEWSIPYERPVHAKYTHDLFKLVTDINE